MSEGSKRKALLFNSLCGYRLCVYDGRKTNPLVSCGCVGLGMRVCEAKKVEGVEGVLDYVSLNTKPLAHSILLANHTYTDNTYNVR